MRYVRKLAMAALIWATASSMLVASTPYYICRCPDGSVKLCFGASATAHSSCCVSSCCAVENKQKPCCQASKKKAAVKSACCQQVPTHQNPDGSPSLSQSHCQKTLVHPEERSFCRLEVKAPDVADALEGVPASVLDTMPAIEASAGITLLRVDKSRPPTDLVVVFHRFTI